MEWKDESAAPEDDDGLITPAAAHFAQGGGASSTGEGILARIAFLVVACGTSPLAVKENSVLGPMLQGAGGELFSPDSVQGAQILVTATDDVACAPAAIQTPSPSLTSPAGLAPDDGGGGEGDLAAEGSEEPPPDTEDSGVLSDQAEPQTGVSSNTSDDGSDGPTSRLTPGPDFADSLEVSAGDNGHQAWRLLLVIGIPTAAAIVVIAVAARALRRRTRQR